MVSYAFGKLVGCCRLMLLVRSLVGLMGLSIRFILVGYAV